MDFAQIEKKWQDAWAKEGLFEPKVDSKKPSFYIQVAYPYPSGAMHIGHARTYTVTDIMAKYHMLKGYNVLMPMGWHVSGTPVIAAVEALQKGNEKVLKVFTESSRIPKEDLKYLTESPESFVDYMVNKAKYGYKAGFKKLGLGIDWRRELKTIDPTYKKFIEWQYKKLYNKGYIKKGKYPVRYCPKDNNPVGDHDLAEGEGLGIQEFTILKFKMDDGRFIVAATLRPETVFGQTNLWVNPEIEYFIAGVDGEEWIGSKEFVEKLKEQKSGVIEKGKISGAVLVGKKALAPGIERKVLVLPCSFCDPKTGTGIVTSVPSDAPIDLVALLDLQKDAAMIERYGLNESEVLALKTIPIIKTAEFGEESAAKIVKDLGIQSQKDEAKLEEAKKIVYRIGFHKGEMNQNCGKYAGMPVSKAKELVKKELIEKGQAEKFYELEGRVVCRCGAECVVRVLEDQWFVTYSDPEWKEESRKTLEKMKIVPEVFRTQYDNVFSWLDDKPCTRSKGLGTRFPWQQDKILEPLADSTIYMAYFTISHIIKKLPPERLSEQVFDFVFLGKGKVEEIARESGLDRKDLEEMGKEFDYWYPLAFNVSATELIPNHMSFSIFQHTAIFPPDKRQKGTLNLGMLVLEGKKMSSSKGNVILINDMCEKIGTDYVRLFLMNSVEPWEEMDWKQREIDKGVEKLNDLVEWVQESALESAESGELDEAVLDQAEKWFLNAFRKRVNAFLEAMESAMLRSAVQEITFKFAKDLLWFETRKQKENKSLNLYITEVWLKCIAPFMPHIAEEIWRNSLKHKESIFKSKLPEKMQTSQIVDLSETLLSTCIEDAKNIMKITGKTRIKKAIFFTAAPWKWIALEAVKKIDRPDFGLAMKEAMKCPEVKSKGKEAETVIKRLAGKAMELKEVQKICELEVLEGGKDFMERALECKIEILEEEKAGNDFKQKASSALPLKPAIFLE
ncbi:MAG: leucine--tRNA ligase [Candidatus Diapherotrites archaeon]